MLNYTAWHWKDKGRKDNRNRGRRITMERRIAGKQEKQGEERVEK